VRATRPDVVLCDIRMPALDGLGLLAEVDADARFVDVRVVMLTTFEHFGSAPAAREPHPQLGELTEREREIVAWVGTGMSNSEIAERLVVSPDTVRTHVSRAMIKLGARDRAQLVVFAIRSGLEAPPDES
jgi:DNA-binding NarL/FixJ family response regulator